MWTAENVLVTVTTLPTPQVRQFGLVAVFQKNDLSWYMWTSVYTCALTHTHSSYGCAQTQRRPCGLWCHRSLSTFTVFARGYPIVLEPSYPHQHLFLLNLVKSKQSRGGEGNESRTWTFDNHDKYQFVIVGKRPQIFWGPTKRWNGVN